MMGHAQTTGHFTLDGSLVNAAPFEDVKRKGVQGGGGVVGVERSKRASGMFGAFSWGNLGESIGGLLGNDDMSSMAQMKATASSKTVPLLSTPQSLLFVDLCLAPGESASYHYTFALPRGLPPSHRGRAIKISYHISLGIQRPGGQDRGRGSSPLMHTPLATFCPYKPAFLLMTSTSRSKQIIYITPKISFSFASTIFKTGATKQTCAD
jgi:hypothetical protein